MAMRPSLLLPALILLLILALAQPTAGSCATPPFRVLVVHSYNAEYIWCGQINLGIDEALRGTGTTVDILYLDAKRNPGQENLRAAALLVQERIERTHPQVVIAADDPAQQYVVAPSLKGRDKPQVIFCGVNAPLSTYGFPTSNISGVREHWHYRDGFALLRRIVPQAKTVAFLVEDSESGGYVLGDLLQEMRQKQALPLRVVMAEKVGTFQQWQRLVKQAQKRADVLALGLYNSLVDETTGAVVPPDRVMAWTNSVNTKPTLGFSDIATQHGLLCGVLESGHEQGYLAGSMARQVLTTGVAAGTLPVRSNTRGVVFVNLRTAKKLGAHIPYSLIEAAAVVVR
jgi:ABC-type uncharacterized transport system substrate-binding protein